MDFYEDNVGFSGKLVAFFVYVCSSMIQKEEEKKKTKVKKRQNKVNLIRRGCKTNDNDALLL